MDSVLHDDRNGPDHVGPLDREGAVHDGEREALCGVRRRASRQRNARQVFRWIVVGMLGDGTAPLGAAIRCVSIWPLRYDVRTIVSPVNSIVPAAPFNTGWPDASTARAS